MKVPQLAGEIRAVVEPHSQADPKFQTPLAFTRITSKAVREALLKHSELRAEEVPAERTLVTILNRMGYCLRATDMYVGEYVELVAEIAPPPILGQLTISAYHWAQPTGTFVIVYDENNNGTQYFTSLSTFDQEKVGIVFYWVAKGNGLDVSVSVTVENNLLGVAFSSAPKHTYFNVDKPTNTITANTNNAPLDITADSVSFGETGIIFNTPSSPTFAVGVAPAAGQLRYTQLVTSSDVRMSTPNVSEFFSTSENELDGGSTEDENKITYNSNDTILPGTVAAFDGPGFEWIRTDAIWISFEFHARMYLYWTSDRNWSIPVAIRYVDWECSFTILASWNADGTRTWSPDPSAAAPYLTPNPPSIDYNGYPPDWDGLWNMPV